jgi:hypothetical protein
MTQPWFRAPQFEEPETCHYCGQIIREGELIGELFDEPLQYMHSVCWDWRWQDERDDAEAA